MLFWRAWDGSFLYSQYLLESKESLKKLNVMSVIVLSAIDFQFSILRTSSFAILLGTFKFR